ncbi:hypothetical protein S40285_03588 [Stachybotrys chlorohalonatus IBT 40285]|uniref:Malate dehydrogenase n=1 Tax=Stachybotrys chlorohalonatus (strain IBT 40285) TaxID=1283841 RepID=A0A084QBP3_STAC4|nr:hypothetical protein S40285_03588 [Stachybotrys chlorohalonata IBT 40285]
MHSKVLLMIGSAVLALASPVVRRQDTNPGPGCTPRPVPVMPVTGGDKELDRPPSNTTLKAIILGFGVQNYTCTSAGATPSAIGALAMLYDVTRLYPGQGPNALPIEEFNTLTTTSLHNHEVPLNFDSARGVSSTDPFTPDAPLELDGMAPIPFAGHHLFNAGGQPIFLLGERGINFVARKIDGIDAPEAADPGPDDTGAVQWLYLGSLPQSTGAQYVYRVLTAGGVSHGCTDGAGIDSTSYTATYWFYG